MCEVPLFTGQERDNESGLDFFQARYYAAGQGRFASPDPGNAGANPADPQSWNGYAYVSNNPLMYTDPSGMFIEAAGPGSAAGPAGTIIGGLIDLGELFGGLFGLFGGGGCHGELSSVASTPTPVLFMTQSGPHGAQQSPCPLSARDKNVLDLYFKPVSQAAPKYDVDPALVLGLGIESTFADPNDKNSTYNNGTGDAFGQTGGSTENMTTAKNPEDNTKGWFANWGGQIQGAGKNAGTFINGLEGINAKGARVKTWKVYNSWKGGAAWRAMAMSGINQMLREIPIYLSKCLT